MRDLLKLVLPVACFLVASPVMAGGKPHLGDGGQYDACQNVTRLVSGKFWDDNAAILRGLSEIVLAYHREYLRTLLERMTADDRLFAVFSKKLGPGVRDGIDQNPARSFEAELRKRVSPDELPRAKFISVAKLPPNWAIETAANSPADKALQLRLVANGKAPGYSVELCSVIREGSADYPVCSRLSLVDQQASRVFLSEQNFTPYETDIKISETRAAYLARKVTESCGPEPRVEEAMEIETGPSAKALPTQPQEHPGPLTVASKSAD